VCNFYAIKYRIRKEDLEVGFVSTLIFLLPSKFDNASVMTGFNGNSHDLSKKDYVRKFYINDESKYQEAKYEKKTQLFKLTEFVKAQSSL
jgi:hypothetical protein